MNYKQYIDITLTVNIIQYYNIQQTQYSTQYDLCFLLYAFTSILLCNTLYICTWYVPKYISQNRVLVLEHF